MRFKARDSLWTFSLKGAQSKWTCSNLNILMGYTWFTAKKSPSSEIVRAPLQVGLELGLLIWQCFLSLHCQ